MRQTWAISGVDLHLDLGGTRVRAGLESALRDAIRTGRLGPGTRLPSSRSLAVDLAIARNTVSEAYGQLVAEGWLTAQQGSGTRVAASVPAADPAAPRPSVDTPRPPRYDLGPGSPNLSEFPRSAWLAAARRALGSAPYEALGYSDPRGRSELRTALAEYLPRARGVRTSPERIVICSGFAQGLLLLCAVLRERGARTLAIEEYILQDTRDRIRAAGLEMRPLTVDEQGAAVNELGSDDAVLLTPAHQFPIGAPLAADRRSRAIEWARAQNAVIIEDDYDGEFRYDRHPLGALQARAPEHVVYAGTASKTLAPGLRVGWLALPADLVDAFTEAKLLADRQPGTLDQLTLAEFIRSGGYDRHVRRSRLAYRRRRDRLIAALRKRAPRVQVTGIAAGLHLLVRLPSGCDEEAVVAAAAARGLAVQGLGDYIEDPRPHLPALVIGYGTPPEWAFTGAVARLCAVLAEFT